MMTRTPQRLNPLNVCWPQPLLSLCLLWRHLTVAEAKMQGVGGSVKVSQGRRDVKVRRVEEKVSSNYYVE